MEHLSRISMDWSNLQFKAKDIIQFAIYIVFGVWGLSSFKNSTERILEKQGDQITALQNQVTEMKNEGKGNSKDFQLFIQGFQNQINTTNTRLSLVEQKVDMLQKDVR